MQPETPIQQAWQQAMNSVQTDDSAKFLEFDGFVAGAQFTVSEAGEHRVDGALHARPPAE
jgi:hypothetical protein